MGFRLRFLCPPPVVRGVFRVNRQGLGGGCHGGGGGSITRNAGAYRGKNIRYFLGGS